jgi:hypothetical protein
VAAVDTLFIVHLGCGKLQLSLGIEDGKMGMDFVGLRNASGWFKIVFGGWLNTND